MIVKNTTLPSLLDLIAPLSCIGCGRLGSPLCDCCKKYIIDHAFHVCPSCKQPKSTPKCANCKSLPPIFVVGKREGILASLIHDFKYNSTRAIGRELAKLLDSSLPPLPLNTIIVPLPTTAPHIRSRALDHTLVVAKSFARFRHLRVGQAILRAKNTTQVGSDRKTREKQAKEAYIINSHYNISPNATYLLFDDVWTTGASMKAALKLLRDAGAKNILIALLAMS